MPAGEPDRVDAWRLNAMPGLGTGHWGYIIILLVIVLIIWGPGKLPDIGSGLGRGIREFRKATSETRDEFTKATRGEDTPASAAVDSTPAVVPATPAPVAQPAPVGGSTPTAVPAERAAGEGDHTTAV
jgi:TatA/E family protein of Tat protein translocase